MPPLQAPYNNIPESSESQFRTAMIQNGLTPPPLLELDGALHRYGNPDNMWYIGWSDALPSGKAGDWKTGAEITWTGNVGRPLSAAEMMQNTVRMAEAKKRHDEEKAKKNRDAAYQVGQIWENAGEASPEHPYLKTKGVQPHGARIGSDGRLILPLFNQSGDLSSLQYIDSQGGKLYHPGGATKGCYNLLGEIKDKVFISEGFATGATIHELTGDPVVVSYSAGSLVDVTGYIRKEFPTVRIIIFADNDKSGTGQKYADQAAAKHGAEVIMPPEEGDANDYVKAGGDLLGLITVNKSKFTIINGADIPDDYEAPDEIIEGLFTSKSTAMIYGDSNAGKTFLAISLGVSVSEGIEAFGRMTDKGDVFYLATESPKSLQTRLQAIKKKNGASLEGFNTIPNPINIHDQPGIVTELINTINAHKNPVKLIIADTLARMSAGANENSGEDMGPVMEKFERIAKETGACVLIIHHSGKDATKGSRGWSGIKGVVDTEIEVVDNKEYKTATINKQRELGSKYETIDYCLDIVEMGISKFGKVSTTCVAKLYDGQKNEKIDVKMAEKVKQMKDCWYDSGMEYDGEYPTFSKSAFRKYAELRLGQKPESIKKMLSFDSNRWLGYLVEAGYIEENSLKTGLNIVDKTTISMLNISKKR